MLNVEEVMKGSANLDSFEKCAEAYCVMQDLQENVTKGFTAAWGGVVTLARICQGRWAEKARDLPEGTDVNAFAAEEFNAQAITAANNAELHNWSKEGIAKYKGAISTLRTAMSRGLDLLEQDEAGNYKFAAKSKVEKWNKDYNDRKEQEERQAKIAEAAKLGINLVPVEQDKSKDQKSDGAKTDQNTTQQPTAAPVIVKEPSVLDSASPELRKVLEAYCATLVKLEQSGKTTNDRNGNPEQSHAKALRIAENYLTSVSNIFMTDFVELKKAANG